MAFNGSSSNRAQLAYKLEGIYPNNFGAAPGGNGALLQMTSESLDFMIKTVTSKAIRSDRLPNDVILTGSSAAGGINGEHVYKEYDPFIQAAMQSDYAAYGTNGVGTPIATLTVTSATVLTAGAALTGNNDLATLKKGQWFSINPAAGATQGVKDYLFARAFRCSSSVAPSSTVLTLDAATPFNVALGGASLSGATIGTAYAWNGGLNSVMKTYSLEVQHTDIGQFRQFYGMALSKFDVKLTSGDIVSMSFEFMGKTGDMLPTSMMGSPDPSQTYTAANATKGIFDVFEGGTSISVTTYIKSADFTIDNTLRSQDAVGVTGVAGIGVGTHTISGKMEVYFSDAVLFNKFKSNNASSLSIPILDPSGNGYVYFFPRIKYTSSKIAVGGQDQDNMQSVDWQALPDTNAASPWYNKSCVIFRVGN